VQRMDGVFTKFTLVWSRNHRCAKGNKLRGCSGHPGMGRWQPTLARVEHWGGKKSHMVTASRMAASGIRILS
jgi:hypothetical protein